MARPVKNRTCDTEGCERVPVAKGLCGAHYQKARLARTGRALCSEPGCGRPFTARGLCHVHYGRLSHIREAQHYTRLRVRYGLRPAEYDQLLKEQDGRCGVCGDRPEHERLVVDHCHDTDRVRGLLCRRCNAAIGGLRDSAELLQRAIEWLDS